MYFSLFRLPLAFLTNVLLFSFFLAFPSIYVFFLCEIPSSLTAVHLFHSYSPSVLSQFLILIPKPPPCMGGGFGWRWIMTHMQITTGKKCFKAVHEHLSNFQKKTWCNKTAICALLHKSSVNTSHPDHHDASQKTKKGLKQSWPIHGSLPESALPRGAL